MSNQSPNENQQSDTSRRTCWVCLATDEDDPSASWLEPCQCRGSSKWVHQRCLEDWIDSKQLGNSSVNVSCPQCNTEYVLVFPPFGTVAKIMNVADRIVYRFCPLMSAGIIVGSIYWTAVTYGAVTVMQILGQKEGLIAMEQADPIILLVGLPVIPVVLILSRLMRWDNFVLTIWRNHSSRIPIIKYFVSSNGVSPDGQSPTERPAYSDAISVTRLLCGALMLPTIASFTGKVMFGNGVSNLHRTVWGGATYLAVKGVCKLYLRQKHYWRLCQRRILNHYEWPGSDNTPPNESSE